MKESLPLIKAAFITQHDKWPWRRQLPLKTEKFGDVEFFVPVDEANVIFVYDALPGEQINLPERALTVFISSEPENVKRYKEQFLAQFDVVITTDRNTRHPNRHFVQPGLPWHVGSMDKGGLLLSNPMRFEDFESLVPTKTKLVSVVSSDKAFTAEHRARLAFVNKLKDAFGDEIDVFGRGINDFSDKSDVLNCYRYHIALENCAIRDYWTEKISDPYLTLTFPIYYGCPNILDYFQEGAVRRIDINKPDEAIDTIREIIGSNLAETNRAELVEARRRVMVNHNVFAMLAKAAHQYISMVSMARRISKNKIIIQNEAMFYSIVPYWKVRFFNCLSAVPSLRNAMRFIKRYLNRS